MVKIIRDYWLRLLAHRKRAALEKRAWKAKRLVLRIVSSLLLAAGASYSQVNPTADSAFLGQFLPTGPSYTNLTRALYAWYKFDEGSGNTALDSSGNNLHAGWTNSGYTWVAGKVGLAMSFDRSLKPSAVCTNLTNMAFPSSGNSGTVTWWSFRTNAFNSGIWESSWGFWGSAFMGCSIFSDNNWNVGWAIGSDHRLIFANTAEINQINTWVWYCWSWGPGSTANAFYTNGVTCVTGVFNSGEDGGNSGVPMQLNSDGNPINTDNHWGGKLDDMRFYTNRLTDAEIDYLYHKWYGQP